MNLDFANLKPSVISWLIVGLMAVTFILIMKWVFTRWPVAGLTEIFQSI